MEGSFLADVSNSVSGESTFFAPTVGDGTAATNLPTGQIQVFDVTSKGDPTPYTAGTLFRLDFAQSPTSPAFSYTFTFIPNNVAYGFGNYEFTDANAQDIADASIGFTSLTVPVTPRATPPGTSTPEPESRWLAAAALFMLAFIRLWRKRRSMSLAAVSADHHDDSDRG